MKQDMTVSLNLLRDLVEFIEVPEVQEVIDGAFDPSMAVESAKNLLLKYDIGSGYEPAMEV